MTQALYMLLGGSLVCLGVIAQAVADRIRGIRAADRQRKPVALAGDGDGAALPLRAREEPSARERAPAATAMAKDVIAALVSAGFKKAQASEAAWGCTAAERATLEDWTGAALRRCAKGAA